MSIHVYLIYSDSRLVMSNSLRPHGLYSPWNSPGQNTGVGSLYLLQGFFPTHGSNPGLPHCRWILYQLSHKESPRILEWIAYPFSSGSPLPGNWTGVFCIAEGFFTIEPSGKPFRRPRFNTWIRKIPWRRKWQPTPLFLSGESHGQRILAGYSPRGCKSLTQLSN